MIMGAIANHCMNVGARCMILTDVGELADQNGKELWDMDTPCSYYSAYVGVKSTYYSNISATLGTVYNGLHRDFSDKSNVPHVLLIDECHKFDIEDMAGDQSSQYAVVINHFKKLNPMLVVVGFTGTPWRGLTSIVGTFWSKKIKPEIDREFLKANGYTHPDVFGFTDHSYDFSEFKDTGENNMADYSKAILEKMQKKADLSTTQAIMHDVMALSESRNGVLITCSGHKHCKEAASVLGDIPWAIVTTHKIETNTKYETRKEIVDAVKAGKVKYLFNIGVFTTGFNAPIIDTTVILRRIGSLVLLEQLLGRGRRLLKQEQIDAGITKSENLVLDFSGTLEAMADLYNNPVLEDAMAAKDKKDNAFVHCPECGDQCGAHARKCHGCGHWFKFRECDDLTINGILIEKGCGAKNDIAAKTCCECNKYLIDPNASLTNKAYTDADWKPVLKMELSITGKNADAIHVKYWLDSFGLDGKQELAHVNYWAIQKGGKRVWQQKFCNTHCRPAMKRKAGAMSPIQVMQNIELFKTPKMATHRSNAKGESIVNVSYK